MIRRTSTALITAATTLCIVAGALAYSRSASDPPLDDSAEGYRKCILLAAENPRQALKISQRAMNRHYSKTAHHCRAISLFTLGNYSESAAALESLLKQIAANHPSLRVAVLEQAALSRQKAGDADAAVMRLTEAMSEAMHLPPEARDPLMRIILQRRSALYLERSFPLLALQDIEHAITLAPENLSLSQQRMKILQKISLAPIKQASAQ